MKNLTFKKLDVYEMKNIKGGVSREEYCKQLIAIEANEQNELEGGAIDGWTHGYNKHGCSEFR